MATSEEYIKYVCDQINGTGDIRYKKMFGEYMVYVNEKPVLIVCDSTVYVKKLDCIKDKMNEAEEGFPYKDAKEHYILDIEDGDLSKEIVSLLEEVTPIPQPKSKKKKKKDAASLT